MASYGVASTIYQSLKRGEEKGYSEITLATADPKRPMVVKREISRKDGSSAWQGLADTARHVNGCVTACHSTHAMRVQSACRRHGE
jgi:hypothetical protein